VQHVLLSGRPTQSHARASPRPQITATRHLQRPLGNQGVQTVLAAQGERLAPEVRAEMESRFGQDFSAVRVHAGADAAIAAEAEGAQAFTLGQHVVFAGGRYAPDTEPGRALLVHELAHVVQQGRGGLPPAGGPGSNLEAEAGGAASHAAGEGPIAVSGAGGIGIARQDTPFEAAQKRKLAATMAGKLTPPSAPEPSAPDPIQASQPLLSILNGPFFSGNNPTGTLSTDIFGGFAVQSPTDPGVGWTGLPNFTLQIRDRLSSTDELGVFGGAGSISPLLGPRNPRSGLVPPPIGTGALGFTWHHGSEAPDDKEHYQFGSGWWLTAGQVWGQAPLLDPGHAPPGWSFNPTANLMGSLGWARNEHGEFDLIGGAAVSRWGQVNGVPVGGFLSPYVGFSYTKTLNETNSVFAEVEGGPYLGLAGRYDSGNGFAASLYSSGGIGWQHNWDDWGFGAELWGFGEPVSSVATPAADGLPQGSFRNWGAGLRINLTKINPRRRNFPEQP
jgi:hypothetical protein